MLSVNFKFGGIVFNWLFREIIDGTRRSHIMDKIRMMLEYVYGS